MLFLIHADPFVDANSSREEKVKSLASVLQAEYNDAANDSEAYLATDYIDYEEALLGSEEPLGLLKVVHNWNLHIQKTLHSALTDIIRRYGSIEKLNPENITLDDSLTYDLKKAAMAADNSFYDFAEAAVYIPAGASNALYFRTVLTPYDISRIKAAPQEYALIDIPAK